MCQLNQKENKISFSIFQKGNAFWHRSNQLGITSNGSFISFSMQNLSSDENLHYGLRIVNSIEKSFGSLVPIAFIKQPIGNYEIMAGRWKKNITSESDLSTGSLIRGKNALPITQISLKTSNFSDFNIFNYNFWVKAGISHGWLNDASYVRSPFIHEKYLYLEFPLEKNIKFNFGLVHEVIWGGETVKHGKQPQKLIDLFYVFIGQPASGTGFIGDQMNALGNHLGIWDLAVTKKSESKIYRLYFQHPFEDKSGMYNYFLDELKNRKLTTKSFDGLLGFEIKKISKGLTSTFLYEYINTMFQSGSEPSKPGISYGWDSYYNHYIYHSGWINNGQNIANPLFTNGRIIENGDNIINNRIKAHHIGISGHISESVSHRIFMTFSKNYGTYWDNHLHISKDKTYKFSGGINQFSGLIQIDLKNIVPNLNGQISYAFDRGALFDDTDSFFFSISYYFRILSASN